MTILIREKKFEIPQNMIFKNALYRLKTNENNFCC